MDKPLLPKVDGEAEGAVGQQPDAWRRESGGTTKAGEYEDFQRDLRRCLRGDRGHSIGRCQRSSSMPDLLQDPTGRSRSLKASDLTHIGGFRREFVHRATVDSDEADAEKSSQDRKSSQDEEEEQALAAHIKFNMKLLTRFFGAEDDQNLYMEGDGGGLFDDRTSLELERERFVDAKQIPTLRRRRTMTLPSRMLTGKAPHKISTAKACFATFKAFIASGILFIPQAVSNAGVHGAISCFLCSGVVSTLGILLLGECHNVCPRSYSEMARAAYGTVGYAMVAFQLAISQACFCTCFVIFVANTIQHLCVAYAWPMPPLSLLFGGVVTVFVPFGWIRRIGDMKTVNLIGDVVIMLVVAYVCLSALTLIEDRGVEPSVVDWNPGRFLCFIGTSIYAFEGIALVIPIRESMKRPELFPHVVCGMMLFFVCLLMGFGLTGYLAWGAQIETIVLNELPGAGGRFAHAAYVCVLLCTFPITIYPTFSICEALLFHDMPAGPKRKWLKNAFRTSLTVIMGVVGCNVAKNLGIFVSILGSFCSIPLEIIFPALLHLSIVGTRKCLCWSMMVLGISLIPVTLYADVLHWTP